MPIDFQSIANRHGFSTNAVMVAWYALQRGGSSMAQFNHPELGGGGQWMPGMLMIGDMFNHGLKGRVDQLFHELKDLPVEAPEQRAGQSWQSQSSGDGNREARANDNANREYGADRNANRAGAGANFGNSFNSDFGGPSLSYGSSPASTSTWYPRELGFPSTAGSQNNVRYAYFPEPRRLAIELFGKVTIFDTGEHHISGVAQGQSNDAGSITFTSQFGVIPISALPVVG
jgi:hypothetical protein